MESSYVRNLLAPPGMGRALGAVLTFSALSHLLGLASPLFVMHVYDRILATRSGSTLVLLTLIFALMLIVAGILDFFRGRILARLTNAVEINLTPRLANYVFVRGKPRGGSDAPLDDLQAIRATFTGPAGGALFDAPWIPLYLLIAFLLHPTLGWVAVFSSGIIIFLIVIGQRLNVAQQATLRETRLDELSTLREYGIKADLIQALGATQEIVRRWTGQRHAQMQALTRTVDQNVIITSIVRTVRLLVQIAILAAAAWLAIHQDISAGTIFAASIIVGRALMPLEVAASSWGILVRGHAALQRLSALPTEEQEKKQFQVLDGAIQELVIANVFADMRPGGQPFLKDIKLQLRKGDVLAVVGSVACGKTSLCRLLVGAIPPLSGIFRLNGLDAAAIDPAVYGRIVGYMPQNAEFFPGTIAENVSRFEPEAREEDFISAARAAGIHEAILRLSNGYETPFIQSVLSTGQLHLLSLARAVYGNPSLLVFDMPESSLDPDSLARVEEAILHAQQRGAMVVLASHHPRLLRHAGSVALMGEGRIGRIVSHDEFFRRTADVPMVARQDAR